MTDRVTLDPVDYYQLQTLFLRHRLAAAEAAQTQADLTEKMRALATAKDFNANGDWMFEDATCSLVAKG